MLVTPEDMQHHLNLPVGKDTEVFDALLTGAQDLFERECGREDAPFGPGAAGRVEVHDGTGTANLFLDYPVAVLTSVTLGRDSADPEETMDTADVHELVFAVGQRRLTRTDGRVFGANGAPRYVHVTYDTALDEPEDARLAITRAVATIYGQRGSEDATAESVTGYRRELAKVTESDPAWRLAVNHHRRLVAW